MRTAMLLGAGPADLPAMSSDQNTLEGGPLGRCKGTRDEALSD